MTVYSANRQPRNAATTTTNPQPDRATEPVHLQNRPVDPRGHRLAAVLALTAGIFQVAISAVGVVLVIASATWLYRQRPGRRVACVCLILLRFAGKQQASG